MSRIPVIWQLQRRGGDMEGLWRRSSQTASCLGLAGHFFNYVFQKATQVCALCGSASSLFLKTWSNIKPFPGTSSIFSPPLRSPTVLGSARCFRISRRNRSGVGHVSTFQISSRHYNFIFPPSLPPLPTPPILHQGALLLWRIRHTHGPALQKLFPPY